MSIRIPSDYVEGYERAKLKDPELAATYINHLNIGDPEADAVIEDLSSLGGKECARLIEAAVEQRESELRDAPESLLKFFERLATRPDWFDPDAALLGCRIFYRHPYVFTASLVGAGLVEGFVSGISRSFFYTGRLLDGNQGVRRLRQNNRHQVELYLPGGLQRDGEGWKLTVRVRLVHAQVRRLVRKQADWDAEAWGEPVSAAHLALANTVFSARVLYHVGRLMRLRFSAEERAGMMLLWRYVGRLMGVPEALLATNEEQAKHIFEVGMSCEPPPGPEAIAMANTLVHAAPVLVGMTGKSADKLVRKVYRLSRALLGNEMANQLQYPKQFTWGSLLFFALEQRVKAAWSKLVRGNAGEVFEQMTKISNYEVQGGISYKLPDNAQSELSKKW